MTEAEEDALHLLRVAGVLARLAGRPRDDAPYDPVTYPRAYAAWTEGWDVGGAAR